MKTLIIVLGFVLLVTSGCAPMYGRGYVMAGGYGNAGYNGSMAAGYSSAPMVGMPGFTPGALPVGARGRILPYGGSMYYGTGYTNPEATMAAAGRRTEWMRASAAVPSTPMATTATSVPPTTVVADPGLTVRVEALEVHALEESLRD